MEPQRQGAVLRTLLVFGTVSTLAACNATDMASTGAESPDSGVESSGSGGSGRPSSGPGGAAGHSEAGKGGSSGRPVGDMQTTGGSASVVAPRDAGANIMDAAIREADSGVRGSDAAVREPDGSTGGSYECSLILGIATTSEWFRDFEKVVDDARWELKFQDSAHIEKWADPANAVWSLPITSPCAQNAETPDRIVFMGVNYDYDSVDLFLPKYAAVLDNIHAKYPGVQRLDVMTYTRAPENEECVGANRSGYSYIKAAQDQAIAAFAAMHPDFVFPAPKWEVESCADFGLCPHLTGPANATIAKTIGTYFLTH